MTRILNGGICVTQLWLTWLTGGICRVQLLHKISYNIITANIGYMLIYGDLDLDRDLSDL